MRKTAKDAGERAKGKRSARQGEAPSGGEPPRGNLLTTGEAIGMVKTTRSTFYRWLRQGKLRGTKVGRQWRFYREDIEQFLRGKGPRIDLPVDVTPLIRTLEERLRRLGTKQLPAEPSDPVERAIHLAIILGRGLRADNLHITTHVVEGSSDRETVLRYRIDGVLKQVATIDSRLLPPLVQKWKAIAGCNTNETKKPQDGRCPFRLKKEVTGTEDRDLDLRISFQPAVLGESVTVRLLDRGAVLLDLDRFGYSLDDRRRLEGALRSGFGLVVVTGPAGSGKTTTLYACMSALSSPEIKAISIEDPVEFLLPWVTQIPVRPHNGVTFGTALRSAMRADPDVILVAEIRDYGTLAMAQQAALTGHLVLGSLFARDAAGALKRMVDMGSDPFIVADSTRLVVAQRLVRKLCPHCRVADALDSDRQQAISDLYAEAGLDGKAVAAGFKKAVGCDRCAGLGYRGRTVIAETLEMTPEVAKALREGASTNEVRTIAVRRGMTTMAADGVRRAAEGVTSVAEVLRAIRS